MLKEIVAAGAANPAIRELTSVGLDVAGMVLRRLEEHGEVSVEHKYLLELMGMSFAGMLLPEETVPQVFDAHPMKAWLQPSVKRIAWSPDVGCGKTSIATALAVQVSRMLRSSCQWHSCRRGLLYCASRVNLLADFREGLLAEGVDADDVGFLHSYSKQDCGVASIERSEAGRYPILLATQAMFTGLLADDRISSAREALGGPRKRKKGTGLSTLLRHAGKERLVVWDESFGSAMADSASIAQLERAVGVLLVDLSKGPIAVEHQRRRFVVKPEDGKRALAAVSHVCAEARDKLNSTQALEKVSIDPIAIPPIGEQEIAALDVMGTHLQKCDVKGLAAAVFGFAAIAPAGNLDPVIVRGKGKGNEEATTALRPRVIVPDAVKRLVVLDANYRDSVMSQMDETVVPAAPEKVQRVKGYSGVNVYFYRGASGRGSADSGGLFDDKERARVIRDQVMRCAAIPDGEKALFITYKSNDGEPDFVGEIKRELAWRFPGWDEVVEGRTGTRTKRVEIVTWGSDHVGSNRHRDVTHFFTVGVFSRDWASSSRSDTLRSEAVALSRGDSSVVNRFRPSQIVANQCACELVQAMGRTNMRHTINGQAGKLTAHIVYKERYSFHRGYAPHEGSPVWEELKSKLPGASFATSEKTRRQSGEQKVAAAAMQVLGELPRGVDQISTRKLKPLVLELIPGGGQAIGDDAFQNGMIKLQDEMLLLQAEGQDCWLKPDAKARSWVRHSPTKPSAVAA